MPFVVSRPIFIFVFFPRRPFPRDRQKPAITAAVVHVWCRHRRPPYTIYHIWRAHISIMCAILSTFRVKSSLIAQRHHIQNYMYMCMSVCWTLRSATSSLWRVVLHSLASAPVLAHSYSFMCDKCECVNVCISISRGSRISAAAVPLICLLTTPLWPYGRRITKNKCLYTYYMYIVYIDIYQRNAITLSMWISLVYLFVLLVICHKRENKCFSPPSSTLFRGTTEKVAHIIYEAIIFSASNVPENLFEYDIECCMLCIECVQFWLWMENARATWVSTVCEMCVAKRIHTQAIFCRWLNYVKQFFFGCKSCDFFSHLYYLFDKKKRNTQPN